MKENIFGQRVIELLEEQDRSQRYFAKEIGISEVSLSRYINGSIIPNIDILLKVASALHTTPNYLLGYELDSCAYNNVYFSIKNNVNKWTDKMKIKLISAIVNK